MELNEHRSVAKKHLIEAVQALGEKLLIQGVGHKIALFVFYEHPTFLFGGGFRCYEI